MLNLHKLMIFNTVAREGSLSAAAERLYMSQSSVSQHIRELESSLGVSLFERSSSGVKLTPKGEQLHIMARDLLRQAAEIERAITDVTQVTAGRLRIGATPGAGAYLIPGWLQTFRARYPNIEAVLHTSTTDKVLEDITHHAIDIGITEGDPSTAVNHVQYHQLTEFEQFIVVGKAHPWWDAAALPLSALDGYCMVTRQPGSHSRTWLENVLARRNVQVQVAAAFDGVEAIKQSVIPSDRCFAVLPAYVVQGEQAIGQLRLIPVADADLKRGLWVVQGRDMPLSPFAEAFVATAKEMCTGKFP